jgi:type II secretory pathway pseudopilin PulG
MTRRFTLVEMMIAIAIVIILAAIAVPEFRRAQFKSKRSEVPLNVEGITVSMLAYDAAHDKYVPQISYVPTTARTKKARAWDTTSAYQALGFTPDGQVRGSYYSPLFGATGIDTVGTCDVDDDGIEASYMSRIDRGTVSDNYMITSTLVF